MCNNRHEFDEDWEEWSPEKGSFIHHMAAGSAAGVVEHVSIFPIDTIKVRIAVISLHSI
jgi:solute carrier family 25 iron transporter 28/37